MPPRSGVNYMKYSTCSTNSNSTYVPLTKQCDNTQSTAGYLAIFCIANALMGIGTTPVGTLGATYLDENVSPKNSPLFIGIWHCTMILGPSVGLASASVFLKQYTNIDTKVCYFFDNTQLNINHSHILINKLGMNVIYNQFYFRLPQGLVSCTLSGLVGGGYHLQQ